MGKIRIKIVILTAILVICNLFPATVFAQEDGIYGTLYGDPNFGYAVMDDGHTAFCIEEDKQHIDSDAVYEEASPSVDTDQFKPVLVYLSQADNDGFDRDLSRKVAQLAVWQILRSNRANRETVELFGTPEAVELFDKMVSGEWEGEYTFTFWAYSPLNEHRLGEYQNLIGGEATLITPPEEEAKEENKEEPEAEYHEADPKENAPEESEDHDVEIHETGSEDENHEVESKENDQEEPEEVHENKEDAETEEIPETERPEVKNCNHNQYGQDEVVITKADAAHWGEYKYVCKNCGKVLSTATVHPYNEYHLTKTNGEPVTVYGWFDYEEANRIFELTNEYRLENGLNALHYNTLTQDASDTRALESSVYFSHTRPDGTKWNTITNMWKFGGENLASGQSSVERAMTGWKESEGHNRNLLYGKEENQTPFKGLSVGVFHRYRFNSSSRPSVPAVNTSYVQQFTFYEY